jgi:hypothetical protein
MTMDPNLEMACAVLPSFPLDVEAYRQNGASVSLQLAGAADGHLQAFAQWGEVLESMELLIPIRHPERGGYDIACEVAAVYFEGGTRGRAELAVQAVRRRKPYRAGARAGASTLASIRVVAGRNIAPRSEFDARLVDVSANGVAFQTERRLTPGDIISLSARVPDTTVFITARVLNVDRSAYGRTRVGCELVEATEDQRRRLAEFVSRNPQDAAGAWTQPVDQRRAS